MSLNEFLANDEFGSWADDVADLPTARTFGIFHFSSFL